MSRSLSIGIYIGYWSHPKSGILGKPKLSVSLAAVKRGEKGPRPADLAHVVERGSVALHDDEDPRGDQRAGLVLELGHVGPLEVVGLVHYVADLCDIQYIDHVPPDTSDTCDVEPMAVPNVLGTHSVMVVAFVFIQFIPDFPVCFQAFFYVCGPTRELL